MKRTPEVRNSQSKALTLVDDVVDNLPFHRSPRSPHRGSLRPARWLPKIGHRCAPGTTKAGLPSTQEVIAAYQDGEEAR